MAKAKTGAWGTQQLESTPKKLVKEEENTQNTPLRPVTRLVKDIEDRAKYHQRINIKSCHKKRLNIPLNKMVM